jgi:hypothetical protein
MIRYRCYKCKDYEKMIAELQLSGKWIKHHANPLLDRGLSGEFDHFNIHAPMIAYHDG